MAKASEVTVEIDAKEVPILDGAVDMAEMGIIPEGMYKNMYYASKDVELAGDVKEAVKDVFYDPQTAGGLLISVKADLAEALAEDMKKNGSLEAKIIGQVVEKKDEDKYIKII